MKAALKRPQRAQMSATFPPLHPTAGRMTSRKVPAAVVRLSLLWTIYGCLYIHLVSGFVLHPIPHAWPTMGNMGTRTLGLRDGSAGVGKRDRGIAKRVSGAACAIMSMTSNAGTGNSRNNCRAALLCALFGPALLCGWCYYERSMMQ